jgi:23S rRNA (pseudouridine1915-N3)-methyltransferase
MKISFITVGKTQSAEIKALCDDYAKRIGRYTKLELLTIESTAQKTTDAQKMKTKEGELLMKKFASTDFVVLLDDKGKEFDSVQFAKWLDNLSAQSLKNVCFVVGGAYGFSDDVYKRANAKLSLSRMTFSHQIVRPIFLEQLYRAFTIINNEPYHHA